MNSPGMPIPLFCTRKMRRTEPSWPQLFENSATSSHMDAAALFVARGSSLPLSLRFFVLIVVAVGARKLPEPMSREG